MATTNIYPNNDQVTNWTASTGTDLYALIDESSTDDTDYISASATNKISTHQLTDSSVDLSSATISEINLIFRAKKSGLRVSVLSGLGDPDGASTSYESATPLITSYRTYNTTWTTNPFTSAAWTAADIEDLKISFKSSILGVGTVFVSQAYVEVTYSIGYSNDVAGVGSSNISTINGIATADISKVNGV